MAREAEYLSERGRTGRRVMRPLAALAAVLALGLAASEVRPTRASGSVAGTVRLSGAPPPSRLVDLEPDNPCAKATGGRLQLQEVVVGPGDGLANVFVRLEGAGLTIAAGPAPATPIVVEQRGCLFLPRMMGARAGQTLRVVNLDDFLHYVRFVSASGIDLKVGQPFAGMEYDFELPAEQEMLRLESGFYPWMHAFVAISEHPWFAVTQEDGRFDLEGVPPGLYDVVLWHERFGTLRREVSVEPGAVATVELAYTAPPSDRGNRSEGVKTLRGLVSGGFELVSVTYLSELAAAAPDPWLRLSFWMPEAGELDEFRVWSPLGFLGGERERLAYVVQPSRKEYPAGRADFEPLGVSLDSLNVVVRMGSRYLPAQLTGREEAEPTGGYGFVFESSAGIDADCDIVRAADGATVRRMECYEEFGGRIAVTWDGRDDSGNPVAEGEYVLRIDGDMLAETIRPLEASVPFRHRRSLN